MPSKIKAVPLRLPPDLRERVQIRAKSEGKSEHALLLSFVEVGMRGEDSPPSIGGELAKTVKARRAASADKLAPEPLHAGGLVPLAGTFETKPMQKTPSNRSRWR